MYRVTYTKNGQVRDASVLFHHFDDAAAECNRLLADDPQSNPTIHGGEPSNGGQVLVSLAVAALMLLALAGAWGLIALIQNLTTCPL